MDPDRQALLDQFTLDSEELLGTIEEALIGLEAQPDDAALLDSIFRAAHTFKGNAFVVGFEQLAQAAHTLEAVLEKLRSGAQVLDGPLATLVLKVVDAFRAMAAAAVAGHEAPTEAQRASHAALERWLSRRQEAAPAPAASAKPTEAGPAPVPRSHTVRVDVEKLDEMVDLAGELAIARGRLTSLLARPDVTLAELRAAHHDADQLHLDLHEQVMKVRMVPIGPTFRQQLRLLRDLTTATGKQARLELEGEDIELDTAVLERLRDPLAHLLRNALDHGLEAPQARSERGKPPCGTVRLQASHEAGSIVVKVSDDGAGLQREVLLARARELRLDVPADAPDEQVFEVIFAPGFSTARTVTQISGRGVGMDVVRRNVEAVRGTVSVHSEAGVGTTITLRLPLTLTIIEGFAVGAGGETFILPLDSVLECVELPSGERGDAPDRGVLSLRGKPLPWVRLGGVFKLTQAHAARESVVVIRWGERQAGLAVDELHGGGQSVVKPLLKLFERTRGLAGTTLLGSGRVALLLDVPDLLALAHEQVEGPAPPTPSGPSSPPAAEA